MSAMQPPLYQYDTNNAPITRPRTLNDYRIGRDTAAVPQQRKSSVLSTGLIIAIAAVAAGSFMVFDPLHLLSPRNATHAPTQSTPQSTPQSTTSVTPLPSFAPVDSPSPTAASLVTPATQASPSIVTSAAIVAPTPMASERRLNEPVAATTRASQPRQVATKSQAPTAKGGTAATRSQRSSTTDTSPSSSVVESPASPTERPKVSEASAVKDDSN